MKIWKSNLQGLLEEVTGPLYVIAACSRNQSKDGQIPYAQFYVAVSGFNSEGRVCELHVAREAVPSMFTEQVNTEMQENKRTLDDLRVRLQELGREVRDGMLGDTPLHGSLD